MRAHVWIVRISVAMVLAGSSRSRPRPEPGPTPVPTATYQLAGTVTEAGDGIPTSATICGYRSRASQQQPRQREISSPGVPTNAELYVTKDEFDPLVLSLPLEAHRQMTIELRRSGPPPNYAGTYTLTIGDGTCGSLPVAARQRSYTATVVLNWPSFQVTLGGADFVLSEGKGNSFSGVVEPRSHGVVQRWDRVAIDGYPWPRSLNGSQTGRSSRRPAWWSRPSLRRVCQGRLGNARGLGRRLLTHLGGAKPIATCASPSHLFTLTR